ncbi:hypothetical protein M8371_28615, partial [Klebsiella pneumoniae]|nr:hypothetical protein [Klebsiella pneumoniae]
MAVARAAGGSLETGQIPRPHQRPPPPPRQRGGTCGTVSPPRLRGKIMEQGLGKPAIVTGAARGIGFGIAQVL